MEMMNKAYTMYNVTPEKLYRIFGDLPKRDHIFTPNRPNRHWLAFEDEEFGIIGQASITKMGPGNKQSNHWRAGGLWIHPAFRGNKRGIFYMSAFVKYMLELMPGPVKYVHARALEGSPTHKLYARMGGEFGRYFEAKHYGRRLINVVKVYEKGADGKYRQINGQSEGILAPGDLEWPMPIVKPMCELPVCGCKL